MKTPSRWYAIMLIAKLDRCEREKISSPPRKLSQVFDKNKDDRIRNIPKNERVRQRPFDEALRADLDWQSQHWKTYWSQTSSSSSSQQCGNTNTKTLNGEITIVGKSDGHRLFQSHIGFVSTDFAYRHQRKSCTRRGVKTEQNVARTLFSVLSVSRSCDLHTHMRLAQDFTGVMLSLCAPQKSSHSMLHRPLLDVPDPFPSFCSTPLPSTSTALPMTGVRRPPLRHSARLLFGHLAESTLTLFVLGFHPVEE